MPWRTIDGVELASPAAARAGGLVRGLFEQPSACSTYLRHFVVFEDGPEGRQEDRGLPPVPRRRTRRWRRRSRGRRAGRRPACGVVWHTQGSRQEPDDGVLRRAHRARAGPWRTPPSSSSPTATTSTTSSSAPSPAATSCCARPPCRPSEPRRPARMLQVASGGVVFTTIQKFLPDERGDPLPAAHRAAQHRGDRRRGAPQPVRLHRRLRPPPARRAARTPPSSGSPARPSSSTDRNTRAVFGDYIDVYDIQRAVEDGATVPIYYESRLAKLDLPEEEKPMVDAEFEEVTEGEEDDRQGEAEERSGRARSDWSAPRNGWPSWPATSSSTSSSALMPSSGKAMVVCMSRRICVELYDADRQAPPRLARPTTTTTARSRSS